MSGAVEDTQLSIQKVARSAAVREACLVHIYPAGTEMGRRHSLVDAVVRFGRGEDCDVRLTDNAASRRHAEVRPGAAGGHEVADLGSTNGTYVNDERVADPRPLRDGDYVRVGSAIYRYLAAGNLEAAYHEEIYRLTVLDGLTQVHNRRALDEYLEREVARSRRHDRPLSVLLLDVDRFKSVNDTRGHLCGDAVLRGVADRVRPEVRAEDLFARYGGEEFALALVETGHAAAVAAAERVRALVAAEPFPFQDGPVRVTVSVGVATTQGEAGAADPAALLKEADGRLYRAKQDGRNRVVGEPGVAETVLAANDPVGATQFVGMSMTRRR